ncbi:MAG: SH3 domain-containing protein [Rhizonema sp. PD38]|nr:SH3 domain-containing protein [Rhizonema sp. PD38]
MLKIIASGLIGLSTALLIALPPTTAASVCKVTDPTGTPLNVREKPNGRVVNAVKNGREVNILESDSDEQGRSWAKVGGYYNGEYKVWGWVLREFISCYERH